MSRPAIRTMTLSVQVTEEAQIVKVSEVLARAQAGLILEGIEASLYSYVEDEEP